MKKVRVPGKYWTNYKVRKIFQVFSRFQNNLAPKKQAGSSRIKGRPFFFFRGGVETTQVDYVTPLEVGQRCREPAGNAKILV